MGFDDEVGLGNECLDVGIGGGSDDRLLASVQEGEQCRVLATQIGARCRPAAQWIAVRRLDLMTSAPPSISSFEQYGPAI